MCADGVGLLFLLAGYHIEVRELTDRAGRRALVTWAVCIAVAVGVVALVGVFHEISAGVVVAIALTSTSLGTLLPILRDRGLLGGPFGSAVMRHGAYGELGPIVAMALLLGSRGTVLSLIVLLLFGLLAFALAFPSGWVRRGESWLLRAVDEGSRTTAQTTVRLTVLLLLVLGTLAVAFDLDGILGAFSAGLVLRQFVPRGSEVLEARLDGLAFGFFIPVFFVTSGMAIDPAAVGAAPGLLIAFVLTILLARGVPLLLAARTQKDPSGRAQFTGRESVQIALFGATGLPIIVAVTAIAVSTGEMTSATASVLVTGGAVTVLLLPLAATLLGPARTSPAVPATGQQPA